MQGINIKKASLDLIGFGMKADAGCVNGDIIPVTRELWLEIANRLQKEKSVNVDKIIDRLEKLENSEHGAEKYGVTKAIAAVKEELGLLCKESYT